MPGRNKGFDPLASLFEPPDLRARLLPDGPASGEDAEVEEPSAPSHQEDIVDPLVKRPAQTRRRDPVVPDPAGESGQTSDPALEEKVALARRLAMEALARQPGVGMPAAPPPAVPSPPAPASPAPDAAVAAAPAVDKEQLARRLAAAARAAASARAPASPPPPPPPGARTGPAAAATADASPPAPPQAAATGAAPVASDPAPAASAPSRARGGRRGSLLDRAQKPVSAREAALLAVQQEASRQVRLQRSRQAELKDVVQGLIPKLLPGLGDLRVENAIAVHQRDVLRALWRGHRAAFLAQGQLERAVGAVAVLGALDRSPEGSLVAVLAHTQASDYLLWLDLEQRGLVAAFADARSYFAGAR